MVPGTQDGRIEWPTVGLLLACYGGLALATTWGAGLWLPLGIALTSVLVTLFSSLQHEVLHGHPFASRRLNAALVFPAVTLYVPYNRFRDTHLAHHHDEILTDPYDDPESNFLDPKAWKRLPRLRRAVLQANNTLLGRMVMGPMVSIIRLWSSDFQLIMQGDRAVRDAWLLHAGGVALVVLWLHLAGQMPFWAFALAAYAGFGILKIRTFLEHQAHDRANGRTVVIEDRGFLAFLFLNNNFHVVHHMHPRTPWYRLPGLYAADRARYLTRNGGYCYRSYAEIFRLFLFKAKDPVPHPLMPQD